MDKGITIPESLPSPVIYLRVHFEVKSNADGKRYTVPADIYIQRDNAVWFESRRQAVLIAISDIVQSYYRDFEAKSRGESTSTSGDTATSAGAAALSRINGDGVAIAYSIRRMETAPYTLLSARKGATSNAGTGALGLCDMSAFMIAPMWIFPYDPATDAGKPLPLDIY